MRSCGAQATERSKTPRGTAGDRRQAAPPSRPRRHFLRSTPIRLSRGRDGGFRQSRGRKPRRGVLHQEFQQLDSRVFRAGRPTSPNPQGQRPRSEAKPRSALASGWVLAALPPHQRAWAGGRGRGRPSPPARPWRHFLSITLAYRRPRCSGHEARSGPAGGASESGRWPGAARALGPAGSSSASRPPAALLGSRSEGGSR